MSIWTPVQDEILRLIPEPTNSVDRNAVAVMKERRVVGHGPFNRPHYLTVLEKGCEQSFC